MKFLLSAVAATVIVLAPVARAADPNITTATAAMTEMLGAIAHPDYAKFVAPAGAQFKANVDPAKFAGQAKAIDAKIPLAQPYTVKYVTTQKVGGFVNYIFEVTLSTGDQVLTSLTLQSGKVAGFHLL